MKCLALLAFASLSAQGCIAGYRTHRVLGAPLPDARRAEAVSAEETAVSITARVDGDAILVQATHQTRCRQGLRYPTTQLVETDQQLTDEGRTTQKLLAGGAGVAALLGSVFMFAPCYQKREDSNGAEHRFDCTNPEEQSHTSTTRVAAYASFATAGALLANLAFNAARGVGTEKETVDAEPITEWQDWAECGVRPAAGEPVALTVLGDHVLARRTTNERGEARFELGALGPVEALEHLPVLTVQVGDASVDVDTSAASLASAEGAPGPRASSDTDARPPRHASARSQGE